MDTIGISRRLAANAGVFRHLVEQVGEGQARWRPAPDKWSVVEVINHLADEERDDFRRRIDLLLHEPGAPWPPIDPPAWARERNYQGRDLMDSVEDFLRERAKSVQWLRGLGEVDGDASCIHPAAGRLTAGGLLHAWVAHDLIHIRQLTRLHYEYLRERTPPDQLGYAGPW